MKVLLHVVQTGALSIAIVLLLKIVSILRNAWLKKAIRMREKYNKKHDFHPENGIEEIDKNSLSYQIDSVEGAIAAVILFLICCINNSNWWSCVTCTNCNTKSYCWQCCY